MTIKRVAHLTSAHPRYDTRILVKMCSSLSDCGYDVFLVVADGKGNEKYNGVSIVDAGLRSGNRVFRMTSTVFKVYRAALKLNAEIYHLHDPELLLVALLLKKKGKVVIFDAHEDLPIQILSKAYLYPSLAKIISKLACLYERYICKKIDAVVTATPFINNKFKQINNLSIDVNNFPKTEEFKDILTDNFETRTSLCYLGGITKLRGIFENVDAMDLVNDDITLLLAGKFSENSVKNNIVKSKGWMKVNELGWLNREEIKKVLESSFAGLVTLHPTQNYKDALPVKMFEYMAAGVPVISSNIPLWKNIIETENCGVCVDPLSIYEIAEAIEFLSQNISVAEEMGRNGREAIAIKYNWTKESEKLINLYNTLLSEPSSIRKDV